MNNIICESCGKRIKNNEQVAVFYDGNTAVYTHVLDSEGKYDCDYVYMLESLNPSIYNSPKDVEDEE